MCSSFNENGNLKCAVPKISIPPTKGTFLNSPPGISISGGACHIPSPCNFFNFPTWLDIPWKEYFPQKCCCTIPLLIVSAIERKPLTYCDASNTFPSKWRLRNKCRNSILMACHYLDLGSASEWLKQISHSAQPIRSIMGFLCSFLKRHFAGKLLVASRNICCFLRLR